MARGNTRSAPTTKDRDILSRLIHGARVSTIISTAVILAGGIGGTVIGLIAGYRGGWADQIAMRAVDFTLAMPFLLVALVVVVVFGQSLELIIVLLILFGWDNFARVVRAETLTLRESDYVSYARIQGASQARILFRHILPGVVGSVLVIGSLRVGSLILTESHPQLPRRRSTARHPRMGHHGLRRSSTPIPCVVDSHPPRRRHLPSRNGLQLPRRLAPRLVRSETAAAAGAVIADRTIEKDSTLYPL